MFHLSREQLYRIALLCFILSLAGGSIFFDFKVFGIQFYAYRLVILVGLLYFLLTRQLVCYTSVYEKYVCWFLSFWLVYASVSLYWCPDRSTGFKEVIYIFLGGAGYLFLLSVRARIPDFERRFAESWIFVFFCVAVFSINELITKSHFLSSFTEGIVKYGEAHKINRVPVFGFDNPNHYAIYLCVTCLLSVYLLLRKIHVKLNVLALCLALFILYFMESRLSQLLVFTTLLFFIGYKYPVIKQWKYYRYLKWSGMTLAVLVLTGGVLLMVKSGSNKEQVKPAMYSILEDVNAAQGLDHPDSGYLTNDVRLSIDAGLQKRLVFGHETVRTRYIDLNKYEASKNLLSGMNSGVKKMIFPVGCVFLALGATLVFRKRKKTKLSLLIFSGALGLILIGMFSRHTLVRMNEKWAGHVVVEAMDARQTDSLVQELCSSMCMIKPASFRNPTAEKYQSGKEITLKWMNLPVDPGSNRSDAARKKLILNGLDYWKRSHFLGVGAGGYASLTDKGEAPYDTGTVNTPHSLIIEILSQYGIVIALFFAGLLLYPLVYLAKDLKRKNWGADHLILLLLLICLVVMGNSNSSSLPLPIIWVNFTLITVFFNKVMKANNQENDPAN